MAARQLGPTILYHTFAAMYVEAIQRRISAYHHNNSTSYECKYGGNARLLITGS